MKAGFLAILFHILTAALGQDLPTLFEKAALYSRDPEVDMDALTLIRSKGYTGEEHRVTTPDGYILRIQRIKCRHNETGTSECNQPRPVVFVMHGLLCSSTNWLTNLQNESLGYVLADAGFDVWMGNARGNYYGRQHVRLNPDKDKNFWMFSWDEMARFDLPSMINYTLNATGQATLYYIGHSQGTMIAFAHFSDNPGFAKRVKKFYALGPVTTVGNVIGPARYVAYWTKSIWKAFKTFKQYEFMPKSWQTRILSKIFCTGQKGSELCEDFLFLVAGFDSNQMNSSRLQVYFSHTPAGTSSMNIAHFGQMVSSGKFQSYDWGSPLVNKLKYGTPIPPVYNVSKMEVPVDLYCAVKDRLADLQDIHQSLIPNLHAPYRAIYLPDFNHLDFLWGMRATNEVYKPIVNDILSIESGVGYV